ncbi:glycerophosphodiester phosphodiesterase family protein [Nonomuraea sp. NPDC048916]|uniref:glycerophosphodiester phosphodiesterase n=1 Tax=Nonomuraea sp. NPDC048916 TaxID=3154232 RepID=UPI0033E3561F
MFRRLGLVLTPVLAILAVTVPADAASRPVIVAHRGASADAPENTLSALAPASRSGADMVEVDVRETRDHALVLMHDTTLTRTTDAESVFPGRAPWRVADFTLAEIRRLDAGSWFGRASRGERVPTLGEALRAMSRSGLGLLLEIKTPQLYRGIEARVAGELRRNPSWPGAGRLVVQSFDWGSMRTFHRIMPDAAIGLLGTPSPGELPGLADFADQVNPPYQDVTAEYVRLVHGQGMAVFTWAVDEPGDAERVIFDGVDGVITNRPGMLRSVVADDADLRAA